MMSKTILFRCKFVFCNKEHSFSAYVRVFIMEYTNIGSVGCRNSSISLIMHASLQREGISNLELCRDMLIDIINKAPRFFV